MSDDSLDVEYLEQEVDPSHYDKFVDDSDEFITITLPDGVVATPELPDLLSLEYNDAQPRGADGKWIAGAGGFSNMKVGKGTKQVQIVKHNSDGTYDVKGPKGKLFKNVNAKELGHTAGAKHVAHPKYKPETEKPAGKNPEAAKWLKKEGVEEPTKAAAAETITTEKINLSSPASAAASGMDFTYKDPAGNKYDVKYDKGTKQYTVNEPGGTSVTLSSNKMEKYMMSTGMAKAVGLHKSTASAVTVEAPEPETGVKVGTKYKHFGQDMEVTKVVGNKVYSKGEFGANVVHSKEYVNEKLGELPTPKTGGGKAERVKEFQDRVKTKIKPGTMKKIEAVNDFQGDTINVPIVTTQEEIDAIKSAFPGKAIKKVNAAKIIAQQNSSGISELKASPQKQALYKAPGNAKPDTTPGGHYKNHKPTLSDNGTMHLGLAKGPLDTWDFSEKVTAWKNSLSSHEKMSIEDWSESGYVSIRAIEAKGETSETVKQFHKALDKAPKYEGQVYRGINVTPGSAAHTLFTTPGATVTFDSSASASRDSKVAAKFSEGSVIMRIKAKTGVSMENLSSFKSEKEVILRKDTKYRIVNVAKNVKLEGYSYGKKAHVVVDMEEI